MGSKPIGAPKGNLNALKHGYYSRRFRKLETNDLARLEEDNGLIGEITLLRVLIRRVFEAANEEADNLDTWIKALKTLGTAFARLATLIKAQRDLHGGEESELAAVLNQAINEVTHEFGLDTRFNSES
jgi:uncharacterized protein YjcR